MTRHGRRQPTRARPSSISPQTGSQQSSRAIGWTAPRRNDAPVRTLQVLPSGGYAFADIGRRLKSP